MTKYPAGIVIRIALVLSISIGLVAPYLHHFPPNSCCGINEYWACGNSPAGGWSCRFSCGQTTLDEFWSHSSCCKFPEYGGLASPDRRIADTSANKQPPAGESDCTPPPQGNCLPVTFICQGHLPDHCWICQLLSVVRSYLGVGNSPCLYNTFCCSADLNCFTPPLLEAYRVPVARGPPSTSPS